MAFAWNPALALGWPGPPELLIILVIALLLFGKRLPEVARGVGRSLTEFKKGLNEAQRDIETEVKIDQAQAGPLDQPKTDQKA